MQLRALGRILGDRLRPGQHRERLTILGEDQAATVLDALSFAAEYRRYRASLTCEACAQHPAELCEDHAADLDRAGQDWPSRRGAVAWIAGQLGGAQ